MSGLPVNKPHRVVPTLTEVLDESLLAVGPTKAAEPLLDLDLGGLGEPDSESLTDSASRLQNPAGVDVMLADLPDIELDLSTDFSAPESAAMRHLDASADLLDAVCSESDVARLNDPDEQAQAERTLQRPSGISPRLSPPVQDMIVEAVDLALAEVRAHLLARVEAAVLRSLAQQHEAQSQSSSSDAFVSRQQQLGS